MLKKPTPIDPPEGRTAQLNLKTFEYSTYPGHPKTDWSKRRSLTIYEAVCLSLGYEPGSAVKEKIGYSYFNLEEEIIYAVYAGEIKKTHIQPNSETKVTRNTIIYADDFCKYLKKQSGSNLNEKPLAETERNTLYKMILAMAMDKYAYNPSLRNAATAEKDKNSIKSAIKKYLNQEISDDTIRNHLKSAADLFAESKPKKKT